MPASTKTPQGPLTAAAAALEAELRRYEETVADITKLSLNSDKALQRARKILEDCAGHQERLGVLLPAFAQAMQGVQQRQQSCMDLTARGTETIKARFEERMSLLERVAALGQHAQDINGPVMQVISLGDQVAPDDLLKSLEDVGALADAVITEAESVHKAAEESDWMDIARDTDALKQQLQAARNKVMLAKRNVASRASS
jgi:uncharacterized protein YoxC